MSVASGSISKSNMSHSYRRVLKYKFTNLRLSFQVRQRVYELLISFDDNVNYEFESNEIERALVEILNESKEEVAYVVKNVFRYDTNNDGVITYQQFTNFCVQQHFGQLAIQRLHRNGLYQRGRQRIMSLAEFRKTLEYSLAFIQIKPSEAELDTVFNDVDLDHDGYITYIEYFSLLREYFGSQSQSAKQVTVSKVEQGLKEKKKQSPNGSNHQKSNSGDRNSWLKPNQDKQNRKNFDIKDKIGKIAPLAQRISKIVFHQFKITAINEDHGMVISVDKKAASQLLQQKLNFSQNEASKIINEQFSGNRSSVAYEKFVEVALEMYLCELYPNQISYPIKRDRFVEEVMKSLHFVKAKPFETTLAEMFEDLGCQEIDKKTYQTIMKMMFSGYRWPRKTGQPRPSLQSPRYEPHKRFF